MITIRSFLFNLAYYTISILYVVLATMVMLLPGRKAVGWVVRRYSKRMVQCLHYIVGIKLQVRGTERLPTGTYIIAAKHQSWFDGFCMFSQFDDVAFVTGDHLEKIPLLGGLLKKLGAIVVDNCGGHKARAALAKSAEIAANEGRKILIYPEGHLSAIGTHHKYRTGVWHMYKNFNLQVVPVATNLGCFAPQQEFGKKSGTAVLDFLEPIPLGLSKAEFMERLETAIENRTAILISEAAGQPIQPSVLVED